MQNKSNPIIVNDYDHIWEKEFIRIKNIIEAIIGDIIVDIHHVGSTSVDGLAAKPIIDIDVEMNSYEMFDEIVERLGKHGYVHCGDQGITGREAFKKIGQEDLMTYHLYVCPSDSEELKRHIVFRDYLQNNSNARDEYARLKKDLAIEYRNDREAYTESKTDFIKSILKKAEDEEV